MNIGDFVRVKGVPPNLKDDEQLKTRILFEKCVGRTFAVADIETPEGLPYPLVRLDVGHVLGEAPFRHTIWIEEQYVETDDSLDDGHRRAEGTRAHTRRIYVSSAIADDYEELERVIGTAATWAAKDGIPQFSRREVLDEICDLIHHGYAQAYLLSAQPPHAVVVEYSESRAQELWYWLTPKGVEFLKAFDAAARTK